MSVLAAAGAGFLLAVLWFDLMFDTLARGHHGPELPAEVRDAIAAYYRRATTTSRPMGRLVAVAMVATVGALIGEIVQGDVPAWSAWASLALTVFAVGLAGARTLRNAVRLGARSDSAERQSELARSILRDHLVCLPAISAVIVIQVATVFA